MIDAATWRVRQRLKFPSGGGSMHGIAVSADGTRVYATNSTNMLFEAEVVAVPLDEHGLEVDELERRLADGLRPKVVYTIPDHQNPAGVSLARERRRACFRSMRASCAGPALSACSVCPRAGGRVTWKSRIPSPRYWTPSPCSAGTTGRRTRPGRTRERC